MLRHSPMPFVASEVRLKSDSRKLLQGAQTHAQADNCLHGAFPCAKAHSQRPARPTVSTSAAEVARLVAPVAAAIARARCALCRFRSTAAASPAESAVTAPPLLLHRRGLEVDAFERVGVWTVCGMRSELRPRCRSSHVGVYFQIDPPVHLVDCPSHTPIFSRSTTNLSPPSDPLSTSSPLVDCGLFRPQYRTVQFAPP